MQHKKWAGCWARTRDRFTARPTLCGMGMCWCSGSVDYAAWRLRTALGDWQARSMTHTAWKQSAAQKVGWLLGQDP